MLSQLSVLPTPLHGECGFVLLLILLSAGKDTFCTSTAGSMSRNGVPHALFPYTDDECCERCELKAFLAVLLLRMRCAAEVSELHDLLKGEELN